MALTDSERLQLRFERDLCTRTEEELRATWSGALRDALEGERPGWFDASLKGGHNPIYYFATKVWFDNQDPQRPLLYEDFHKTRICDEVLAFYLGEHPEKNGMVLLAQRDSFKTTFMHGVFPMWAAIREKWVHEKDIRIALIHHREELASRNLVQMKQKCIQSTYMHSVWGGADAGPKFAMAKDWDTSRGFNWNCRVLDAFKELSVIAASLGTRLTGDHYDLMLMDDIVTMEHASSPRIRADAGFRFNSSLPMLDTFGGLLFCSGTYYHPHDLWSKLEKTGDYHVVRIRSGGTHVDEPLSLPSRHTQKFLDKKLKMYKAQNEELTYWLQYQLEVKSEQMLATDTAWIHRLPQFQVPIQSEDTFPTILVDPAWKGINMGQGDYAAIAVVMIERAGPLVNRYLCELTHSKMMNAFDGEKEILRLMRKWGAVNVFVEEHGGHTFRTNLEGAARQNRQFINLLDLKMKQTSKAQRIAQLVRHAQAGGLFVTNECENAEVFIEQFGDWPQVETDDALDAVAYSCAEELVQNYIPLGSEDFDDRPHWMRRPEAPEEEPRRTLHTTV